MCGIFGYVGSKDSASKIVLDGLKRLEYRGYDSWGVGVIPNKITEKIVIKKKAGKIRNATIDELPGGSLAFGHTRWATHGGVTDANSHPHLDCTGTIAVVHNGIFENYEEVKAELLKKGHRFISETDTEVVAHFIEEHMKRGMSFVTAVQKTFSGMEGLNAIIVICTRHQELVAIRNGSPLVIGFGKDENYLASDAIALLPHTRKVYFLKDDEMAVLSAKTIQFSDIRTRRRFQPKPQILTWSPGQAEKGDYPHFMLKEIHEQPGIISEIAVNSWEGATMIAQIIKNSQNSYLVGCGSAAYASIAGTYLFSKIAKQQVNAVIGSEFGYQLDFLNKKSLVIAISQSGETMDILESVKKAKEKGAKLIALVNVLGSTLYREADGKILIGAGPEKSVASTKALTAMIAHLVLLAYALSGKSKEGANLLVKAARATKTILESESISRIKVLAKKLKDQQHIYVVGRGLSYVASLETAMKIKEISYIHAEGLAAGELKHGPLALVEKGTPCIVFIPNDETYGAALAGAMEMRARGGMIIGISYKPAEVFDYFIPVADVGETTIIPGIVVGQALAYYLTRERGFDPDMPRNLAKSVTVK